MTRRTLWPLAALLLGLLLALALLAGALVTSPLSSREGELPQVLLAADKSTGVNTNLGPLDAAQREQLLTAMEAAGFPWLRQRFSWGEIEPERGVYDWALWDEIVDAVARHNIRLIAVLDGSPGWALAPHDFANPYAPPVETRHFGDWAAALAARYGDRIDYYQVWDEPNIRPHWGAGEINPAAYARLLREGAIRVRAADPGATILTAALAPNVEPGGANMSELQFLDALYDAGAAEWFDVVAAQPYPFEQPLEAAPDSQQLNWQRVSLLRSVMEAHGDAGTAVWAVSFGWPGDDAGATAAAVQMARREWPWLGPMLWAAWSPGDMHGEYALVDRGGSGGAAYRALAGLGAAPAVAWPGVYPADHPSGRYQAQWRVAPSLADIGQSGDTLVIDFHGTGLDLIVRRGPYRAFLFVTVDGEPADALPRDAEGRAYVVLYDPLAAEERVALARDLAPGDHVAEIVAEGGWGQWAIAGWAVQGGKTRAGVPWVSFLLGLLAAAVLVVTVRRAWRRRFAVAFAAGRVVGTCDRAVAAYRALDPRVTLALTAAAAVLAYVMDGTLPTLAALGLLGLLLILHPEAGLPLIAFSLPFYQPGRPLLGKVFSMTEILVVLTALGWGIGRFLAWADRKLSGGWFDDPHTQQPRPAAVQIHALDGGVVALVLVAAASLLWAEHGRVAAREFRTVVLDGALFYALVRLLVRERRDVWRLVDAWVAGAAAVALVGIGQWLLGANVITADGVWRVRGFYGSPNNLALYLGRALPLALVVGAWGKSALCLSWRGASAGDRLRVALGTRRWAYAGAALVIAVALFFTYSRGAWVVGVPVSLLFLAVLRGRRTALVVLAVLVLAAVLLLALAGPARLTSLLDTEQGTTFFRLQLWQSSWAMVRDHPLLGVGLDNFLYHYRTHYVLPTAWEEFDLSHPHNLLLDFWLRLGLPGLLVAGWLLVAFFRAAGRLYRTLSPGDDRLLVLGLLGGMAYLVAHGLVDNAFFLVDLAFSFLLMTGLLATLCRASAHESRIPNTEPPIPDTQDPISNPESSPCAS